MGYDKTIISFILVIVTFVSSMTTNVFAQQASTITAGGYTFKVLRNDYGKAELAYHDVTGEYTFTLNKMNPADQAPIEASKADTLTRSNEVSHYAIYFDKNIEYTSENMDISSVILVDEDTNDEYLLNPNARVCLKIHSSNLHAPLCVLFAPKSVSVARYVSFFWNKSSTKWVAHLTKSNFQTHSRLAWAIPVGIALTEAAIAALLELGVAIVISGVACVVLEEAYAEIKRQKEYRYYRGYLRKGSVYAGDGIRKELAQGLAQTEDSNGTVIATTYSYAIGITSGSYSEVENHGAGDGFWDHIHKVKPNGTHFKAHIWFL